VVRVQDAPERDRYEPLPSIVTAILLDQVVGGLCDLCGVEEIDYMKMDCEGCENSSLGCANQSTLKRIRFISGEYHDLRRFERVMEYRLFKTHFVNIVGDEWGSFFAERSDSDPSILSPALTRRRVKSDTGIEQLVEHHPFRDEFVFPSERWTHGL
jgi:hypothetical protein